MYDYDRSKIARGEGLDSGVRVKANQVFNRIGLDGNGRFRKVGEALSKAFEALAKLGIEPGEVLSAHKFSGSKGSYSIDLAFGNALDPFSPTSISNSTLFLQWQELSPGRFEVVGYLS